MNLRKQLKNVKIQNAETIQSYFTRVSQIKEQLVVVEEEVMNEEDDEAECSRRSLPTKQIKISIQLSFHDIILLCICLYSVDVVMHDSMFTLMTIYC